MFDPYFLLSYLCACITYDLHVTLCFSPALPPDAIEATEICTNDFTVSWNFTEGLTYVVEVLPPSMMDGMAVGPMMDTFYTFHELLPNTVYRVSVTSRMDTCLGIPNTIMITTLTEQEGLPQSELTVMNTYVLMKHHYYLRT